MNNSIVYNEDNKITMSRYPDKYFDLAVVDPPYGINAPNMNMGTNKSRNKAGQYPSISTASKLKGRLNSGGGELKNRLLNTSNIDWDNEVPTNEYFEELKRISKNQIIWGGNYFHLPPTRGIIIWNKNQPWDNFSQAEIAWSSFDCPAKLFTYSNRGGANLETKIHPTQKPIYLYDYCFKYFGFKGMKVYDSHVGSGSSRISADRYEAEEFVGSEINTQYFNDQEQRYFNYKKSLKLDLVHY